MSEMDNLKRAEIALATLRESLEAAQQAVREAIAARDSHREYEVPGKHTHPWQDNAIGKDSPEETLGECLRRQEREDRPQYGKATPDA